MSSKRYYTVYDRNVEAIAREVSGGGPMLGITADEAHKTIDTVLDICRWLLSEGADRSAVVNAVGGGVTTDLVGFAASIYKRGVKYVNYPTTLLSQVDAGIGGKTGCNLDGYKNMLGVTRFPASTVMLPQALRTLPERELRSGAAELLKTFIIGDAKSYGKAVELLSAETLDFDALGVLARKAADIKRRIVEKDPYEENLRRVLNLGHTFAHAIEWHSGGEVAHGLAVAMGMVRAAEISERMGVCGEGLADRLRRDFTACRLPVDIPFSDEELAPALGKDKKAEGDKLHFILIRRIGKVEIKDLSIDDLLKHTA